MREDQGGVYGVSVSSTAARFPKPLYTVTATWGCNPENIKKLSQTVLDEMEKIKKDGPTEVDLNKVKETLIREMETRIKENSWWMSILSNHYYQGDTLLTLDQYKNAINAVKGEDIKMIANRYLDATHYVQVALTPAPKTVGK